MKSNTTSGFWKAHDGLPAEIRRAARRVYVPWRRNPDHPSPRFKCVSPRHGVYLVRIGLQWSALGYRDRAAGEDRMTWFWIGSPADYDRLTSSL